MKKPLIILIIILTALLLAGGIFMCLKLFRNDPYDKDGKLKNGVTLSEIQRIDSKHGELIAASYHCGGGMNGDTFNADIERTDDGPVLTVRESGMYCFPLIVRKYTVPEEILTKLRAFSDEYNLPVWEKLPYSDEQALDAPTASVSVVFNDRELGGGRYESYRVSFEQIDPKGGEKVLAEFRDIILSCAVPERQTDCFFEDNGSEIRIGADIENTDEQAGRVISGYWRGSRAYILRDDGTRQDEYVFSDDDGCLILDAELGGTLGLRRFKQGSDSVDFFFTLSEPVHERLDRFDCSWHAVLMPDEGPSFDMSEFVCTECEPASGFFLVVEGEKLLIVQHGEHGGVCCIELGRTA